MAKRSKRTKTKTPQRGGPSVKVVSEGGKLPAAKRSAADFVRRRTEVEEKDHAEFQTYLAEKKEADARKAKASAPATAPTKSRGMSRRTMFNVAVGTAASATPAVPTATLSMVRRLMPRLFGGAAAGAPALALRESASFFSAR